MINYGNDYFIRDQYIYLKNLENDLFSDLESSDDLLSYYNYKYDTINYEVDKRKYCDNYYEQLIRDLNNNNKIYQNNNKKQNITYNNKNNNIMQKSTGLSPFIHVYRPIYNNYNNLLNKKKCNSKDEHICRINNYQNNFINNNNNDNDLKFINNYMNKDSRNYNNYCNYNNYNFLKSNTIKSSRKMRSTENISKSNDIFYLNIHNNKNKNKIKNQLLNSTNKKCKNLFRNKPKIYNNYCYKSSNIFNNNIKPITIRNFNKINSNRKKNIKINKNDDEDKEDEENLSLIAEDLVETLKLSFRKDNILGKKLINNKDNKDNKSKKLRNKREKPSKKKLVECGCQTSDEKENIKKNNINNNKKNNNNNIKKNQKIKVEKKDEGTDAQLSLLKYLELSSFRKSNNSIKNIKNNTTNTTNLINKNIIYNIESNNNNNNIKEKKEEEKEKNNIEDCKMINDLNSKCLESPFDNKMKEKEKIILNYNEDEKNNNVDVPNLFFKENNNIENKTKEISENNNKNLINIEKEKEYENDKKNINDLFGEYIDTERELEIEKNNKIKRRVKINIDENYYYNFLIGGFLKDCQVKKGSQGIIEQYEEKKEDVFQTAIRFKRKSTIKKFDKNDIKKNDKYVLCENLKEEQIIPELFEDENKDELEESYVKELASSLKSSIDKSFSSSINKSIQQSYNQSYNQSYSDGNCDSLHDSKLKTSGGKGLLNKLGQTFDSIVEINEDDNDNDNND